MPRQPRLYAPRPCITSWAGGLRPASYSEPRNTTSAVVRATQAVELSDRLPARYRGQVQQQEADIPILMKFLHLAKTCRFFKKS